MTRYSTGQWKQPQNTYCEVRGRKLFETYKAVHIDVTHISGSLLLQPKKKWFPISQIQKSFSDPIAMTWSGMVAEWILEKNGLLDDLEEQEEQEGEETPGDNTPEAYDPYEGDIPF